MRDLNLDYTNDVRKNRAIGWEYMPCNVYQVEYNILMDNNQHLLHVFSNI